MTARRVSITKITTEDDKTTADIAGVSGEELYGELWQPHGLSSNPTNGDSVLLEINDDPDNFLALPSGGTRQAEAGTTVLYYGNTEIILNGDTIIINVSGSNVTIADGKLTTDLDIITSGDVVASGVSLKTHVHSGVEAGPSNTGQPV